MIAVRDIGPAMGAPRLNASGPAMPSGRTLVVRSSRARASWRSLARRQFRRAGRRDHGQPLRPPAFDRHVDRWSCSPALRAIPLSQLCPIVRLATHRWRAVDRSDERESGDHAGNNQHQGPCEHVPRDVLGRTLTCLDCRTNDPGHDEPRFCRSDATARDAAGSDSETTEIRHGSADAGRHYRSSGAPAIVSWINSERDRAPIFFMRVARCVSTVRWLMPRT
jgi:hypothetical protein